jgi:hypothetical protein
MRRIGWLGIVLGVFGACCGTPPPCSDFPPVGVQARDAASAEPPPQADVPPPEPVAPPGPVLPPGSVPLVERARRNLQQRMALGDPGEIRVISVEAVEWGDAGLDCPDPEMDYANVVTPGFLIVLEAADRTFEYHSDTNYSIILCDGGRPVRGGL